MRRDALRRMAGILGLTLALLIASTTPVHAGYTQPGSSGSLLGEVSAFIGDFNQWNSARNGLPMQVLSMVPASEESQAVLFLFMMWLRDPLGMGASTASSGNGSSSNANGPGGTGGAVPVGTFGMGQNGNNSPSSNGGSSLGSPSPQNGGGTGGSPLVGGGGGGPTPAADPTPEPASFTLLAVGGVGLLMGWRKRSRKSSSN